MSRPGGVPHKDTGMLRSSMSREIMLVGGPCDGGKLTLNPWDVGRGMIRIACSRPIASTDPEATENDLPAAMVFGLVAEHIYLRREDGKYEWDGKS